MKKLIAISVLGLISTLLVSCAPVNSINVPVNSDKANESLKDNSNITAKPESNNTVSIITPSASSTNNEIRDPKYGLVGVDKTIEAVSSPSPNPTPTFSPQSNNNSYPTSPSENNMNSDITNIVGVLSPKPAPSKVPYREDWPIYDVNEGIYWLIFKDEYRVRYDKEKKVFYSLTGDDLKSINELIVSDNIQVFPYFSDTFTEEQMSQYEQESQATGSYTDFANPLSRYILDTKNLPSREFINKVRENNFVRQFNYYPPQKIIND